MNSPNAVSLAEVADYLDHYLRIDELPDSANALNGLQVENGGTVTGIVAAVDASQLTIDTAVASTARSTLLLVHHGLFWDGNQPFTGRRFRRIKALLDHDSALYAAHIPLDAHPEVGNNAVLARMLDILDPVPFTDYHGAPFGAAGHLIMSRDRLVALLEEKLGTKAHLIAGGPDITTRVGVVTGAGGSAISDAIKAGLDTFITGEVPHHAAFDALEGGINLIHAGHYATETVGVKALAEHLAERFGVPWEFQDHPTGI